MLYQKATEGMKVRLKKDFEGRKEGEVGTITYKGKTPTDEEGRVTIKWDDQKEDFDDETDFIDKDIIKYLEEVPPGGKKLNSPFKAAK